MRRIWSFSSAISFLQSLYNSTWYHFSPLLSLRSMSSSAIPLQGPRLQVLSSQVSSQLPSTYFISESGRQQDTAAIARSLNLKLEMKVSFTKGKKKIKYNRSSIYFLNSETLGVWMAESIPLANHKITTAIWQKISKFQPHTSGFVTKTRNFSPTVQLKECFLLQNFLMSPFQREIYYDSVMLSLPKEGLPSNI